MTVPIGRVLVAGWFSFADGHATAGDLMSRDLVCRWLSDAGIAHDFATDPPFTGGVDWRVVDPATYSHVVFVCGPFGRGVLEAEFLTRFAENRLIGLNLSMSEPVGSWMPFDLLIERDSTRAVNPDLVFGATQGLPPVAGLCLVEPHDEAPRLAEADAALTQLLEGRRLAVVPIDTRLDSNSVGLHSPPEVEALIARMDVVVTTRLHGLVLALRNGVPVLAVDAVPGGGKILRQCRRIGWTNVIAIDEMDRGRLEAGLDAALAPDAGRLAREIGRRAREEVEEIGRRFRADLSGGTAVEDAYRARLGRGVDRYREDIAELLVATAPEPETPPPSLTRRMLRRAMAALGSK